MNNIIHSTTGLIHLISAIVALILGTGVLIAHKGTAAHRRMGYGYAMSMLVLNGTAFGLYHLFKGFGPFHAAAIISLLTLLAGLTPFFFNYAGNRKMEQHIAWMYFSVIGLYAAFASELIVRIPGVPFSVMVGAATFLVMIIGIHQFRKRYEGWRRTAAKN
ncbi:MAG: DUF2306 domain-containing protein [Cyclobacteriaceae bacterium]|jgi:uncharacterized membrane protein|nr:DUF2306 domain-containing protein [Cyclobacteriaceae bacterium]